MPAKDLKELIAWLKANPDKATSAHAGVGGAGARQRRLFPERDRHQASVRAVSRRGAGDAGPGGGPDRLMFDQASSRCRRCAAATSRRIAVHAPRRAGRRARHSDRGRGRRAGTSHVGLARLWAPKGTPKDIVAQAQRGGASRRWPIPRCAALRRPRPGHSAARAADAGGAARATTRPRSRSGGRSSRPPASRRE